MEQSNDQNTEQRIKQDFKYVIARLYSEIKKDYVFFSSCGFFVSWSLVLHSRLKTLGVSPSGNWADDLFADFIPINVFVLIFLGFIGFGSITSILTALGWRSDFLLNSVSHIESRFAQLTSSILCFSFGVAAHALLHSLVLSHQVG